MHSSFGRVQSIDTVRGLVMVIMALDHVRDYFHVTAWTQDPTDLSTTTPALFFTRWITHFCAPVFVFLAGTSAYLLGQKKSKKELSSFLIKRGVWLIIVEITIIAFGWTFDPLFHTLLLAVIWVIGWSMLLLGLLIYLPFKAILAIGLVLFLGHNIFDLISLPKPGGERLAVDLFFTATGSLYSITANRVVIVLYAILPWTSVMILGYTFGRFFHRDVSKEQRQRWLLYTGCALVALFILLRFIEPYGDPSHWSTQKTPLYTFLSFINTTKYPPSLEYLCMTLGPAIILLALIENVRNRPLSILSTYGRVPFFYYVLHLYLIHLLTAIAFFATGHSTDQIVSEDSPFLFRPATFGFGLIEVYGIWLAIVVILYPLCRWYNNYRASRNNWWLSYL